MSDKRTEAELTSVPSMTLDREDIAHRQSQRATSHRVAEEAGASAEVVAPRPKLISRRLWMGTGAGLALALAGIAWLFLGLQQATENLAAAALRIEQLEARLASTDTTITQSEVLLADKLKSMDQLIDVNKNEVRKLWGLAGDTQRKAIEQAKATNEQQNLVLKTLQEQAAASELKIADHQGVLEQLGVTAKNSEASAREAVQRMEIMQEGVSNLGVEVKQIKQKQTQQEGDYSKRITALEDTARSTDVFRRNTQEELRKMREELLRQNAPAPKNNF